MSTWLNYDPALIETGNYGPVRKELRRNLCRSFFYSAISGVTVIVNTFGG